MLILLKIAGHHHLFPSSRCSNKVLQLSAINTFNGVFSTIAFSPELPDWFKFAEGAPHDSDSEDDFSLSVQPERLENRPDIEKFREFIPSDRIENSEASEDGIDQISNALKSRFRSPDEVISNLSNCSSKISKELVDRILKRFSNDWIPAMGFFRWADLHMGYKHSPDTYDLMIDILGKTKQFDVMWNLIDEMNHFGRLISLSTMAKVIRRLAGAARWKDAILAFDDMEHFGISKNTEAMNILLDSLCKERGVRRARDVFSDLKGVIPPNPSSFNILIHGWCKARKLEEAWQTLGEMRDFGFIPCVITYTSLIEAYCSERNFLKVEAILHEMRSNGCPPNIITYTIVMHSFGKAKETQAAFSIFNRMKIDGCLPDASAYNSLIYTLGRTGQFVEAYRVYEEMHRREISPNMTTFNTLISAACNHSQENHALKLLGKMQEASCRPDIKTYTPLLKLSFTRKWMRVLLYLLGHMFKRDISLDLGAYTMLVGRLCRAGKVKQACIFYEEMVLKGLIPKNHSSAMLLEALERKNLNPAKFRVQKLMAMAGSMPQSTLYTDKSAL